MKKIIVFILAFSIMIFAFDISAITALAAGQSIDYGDADGTDGVTAADALLALRHASGQTVLAPVYEVNADVDGKDGVTAIDALLILQYVLGLIQFFPVQDAISVSGYVIDETGSPVVGAVIRCPQRGGAPVKTNTEGKYTINAPVAGAFDLMCSRSGYANDERIGITQTALDTDTSILNFVVAAKLHKISGKLTFVYDMDAAGAELFVQTDQKYIAVINPDGTYVLEFAANKYVNITPLYLTYNGFTSVQRYVPVGVSAMPDGAEEDITVLPNAVVSGIALDDSNNPIIGATVKIEPKIDLTSAGDAANTKTLVTVVTTNEQGEYSNVGFLPYFGQYTVTIETLDPAGAYTNEKGQRVSRRVTVVDARRIEDIITLTGVAKGNFYSPQYEFTAMLSLPPTGISGIKWFAKNGSGVYIEQSGQTSASLEYHPTDGVSSQIKAEVTLANGAVITKESDEFKYNYVPLLIIDPLLAANFTLNPDGTMNVSDTVKETDTSFFNSGGGARAPEVIADITFISGFTMSAVFEIQSGITGKNGNCYTYAGLLATGRRTNGRANMEYPSGGIAYHTSNSTTSELVVTHANQADKTARTDLDGIRIRVVAEFHNNMSPQDIVPGTNHANILTVNSKYYNADTGELITTVAGKTANANSLFDDGFMYPGLTFDNVVCKVSDIIFTADEELTIRRDSLKKLIDTPGANALGQPYTDAVALHNITDGSVMSDTVSSRANYKPFAYRDKVNISITSLKQLLGL